MSQQILSASNERVSTPAPRPPLSGPSLGNQGVPPPILKLQRMLGNRRVAQLIQSKRLTPQGRLIGLQPKLVVGAANDSYEQEADRVSRQVLSMSDSAVSATMKSGLPQEKDRALQPMPLTPLTPLSASITPFSITPATQRQMENIEEPEEQEAPGQAKRAEGKMSLQRQPEMEEEKKKSIQAKNAGPGMDSFEAGDEVESRLNQSKGGGSRLPEPVRAYMEPRFGMDFSHVRVHTGSESIQMNRDVGARAFTHGSDIYYGADSSPGDLALTAHELTHVVQQMGPVQGKSAGHRAMSPDYGELPARPDPDAIVSGVITPFVQRDKIPHGSLVWDDFKGKVPKKAKNDAATYSNLEDPELGALIPKNAALDTGEPCKVKGKERTRFTVDITIDSAKIEVKSFMDQDKSWHKAWTTDDAARQAKCKKEWMPKCKKTFDKQIAKAKKIISKSRASCEKTFDKTKKEATKQCTPFVAECKTAFKRGDESFTIEIGDSEIQANTAKECTSTLLPGCIASSMEDEEVSETVDGESATAKSKAECKTVLAPELEKLLKDQMEWEASSGGTSVSVKKREDCSTTFIDSCAADLLKASSEDLLKHEQTHFDLTDAMAQKAQGDLRTLVDSFPTEVDGCGEAAAKAKAKTVLASELAKLKKMYAAHKKLMSKKQAQYDKETKHGVVEKKQAEWEEKISKGF